MGETFLCLRCLRPVPFRAELRFCPHCGLAEAKEAALDTAPVAFSIHDRDYQVYERIAIGSICNLYRCRFKSGISQVDGIFKVARDARSNGFVFNEADVLRRLHAADSGGRFAPFLPALQDTFSVSDGPSSSPRQGNVLKLYREIHSPDELYTLQDVRAHYPGGLDGRDVAWIWRRLLSVLGFIHLNDIIHGAVLPTHVLIEPAEHKLVLIDWCCAAAGQRRGPVTVLAGGYADWYDRSGDMRLEPSPALDVSFAARCMIELLGGDSLAEMFPSGVEPALQRHFQRCAGVGSETRIDAWKLLEDFDGLIDALWGPRQFRSLVLPPKHIDGKGGTRDPRGPATPP